jgi:hypothetical protein
MPTTNHLPQGAQAPIIFYNNIKLSGNDWFQWYKQYLNWLENMPKDKVNLLAIMGLTESYYLKYINQPRIISHP